VRILESVLMLYAWLAAIVLLAFLFLIARFFELKSGERTYFRAFVAPAILFLIAGARYALYPGPDWLSDAPANLLFCIGGLVALVLGRRLLKLMTGGRP